MMEKSPSDDLMLVLDYFVSLMQEVTWPLSLQSPSRVFWESQGGESLDKRIGMAGKFCTKGLVTREMTIFYKLDVEIGVQGQVGDVKCGIGYCQDES